MPVLDTTLRCKRCGGLLDDAKAAECPRCHSSLDEVGVTSELIEWPATRQKGRRRYIWLRHVLGSGGMIFLAFTPVCLWLGGAHPLVLFCWSVLVSFGGGYLIGWFHWRAAEREYAEFMNRDHDQQPVHEQQ